MPTFKVTAYPKATPKGMLPMPYIPRTLPAQMPSAIKIIPKGLVPKGMPMPTQKPKPIVPKTRFPVSFMRRQLPF